ncbi:hypothetical protein SDRG_00799 [Saprolegnia diclina VS20]|uniref:IPT/TIG domain-containing protein n=1 Tax=Saprolegnia diclina (strain VS20) TaxID=1156394 RepID=T0QUU4_SAPDV|nr:hypothetical protein SDRG_00799 [Saprolegnia diclina VS20]EQC41949.1 hypothetical protein SDRG_00799 [Saprolegnia diclina VS20]|eukprot:XP_008604518.1 hypothetical protein SDRG_00799 [Saprolegnia diclina VS20]
MLAAPRRARTPFELEALHPACGPVRGGTELVISGAHFNGTFDIPRRVSDVHLRSPLHETDAKVRFQLGDKILTQVKAKLLSSKKLLCTTPRFNEPVRSTNHANWGSVTICVSLEDSTFVPCRQRYQYYLPTYICDLDPPTIPEPDRVRLTLRAHLSVGETPQTPMTDVETLLQRRLASLLSPSVQIQRRVDQHTWRVMGSVDTTDMMQLAVEFPEDAGVGQYTIAFAWNGVDFDVPSPVPSSSEWADWGLHNQFEIFRPPSLRSVRPHACFYLEGQTLHLDFDAWQAPGVRPASHAIVRFERECKTSSHCEDYKVLVPMADGELRSIAVTTPWFHEAGLYDIAVSVNGGVHFTRCPIQRLLVYHKPLCEFVSPEYGISRGNTELSLRIAFAHPRVHEDHPLVPLEDANVEACAPTLYVRFTLDVSGAVLATVPATLSSCHRFVQCRSPKNTDIESFQYSQVEAVALSLSFDDVHYFALAPKKPFRYYAPPRLRAFSTTHGPYSGGTPLIIDLWHPLPDCISSRVRFRCLKTLVVRDAAASTHKAQPSSLVCVVPPWPRSDDGDTNDVGDGEPYKLVLVEVTLNGVDFHTDTMQLVANPNAFFRGLSSCFLYYRPPRIFFVSPAYVPTTGTIPVVVHGDDLNDYGGTIQVAFSNGASTRYVPGRTDGPGVVCTAPPFAAGVCNVAVALNGQQFTGDWNGRGDCTTTDLDSQVRFFDVPMFSALAPARGPLKGGTLMQIFGTGFVETGALEVRFSASDIEYEEIVPGLVTDGVLRCTTPRCPIEYTVDIAWSFSDRVFLEPDQKHRRATFTYAAK